MAEREFASGKIRAVECVKEAFAAIRDEYWVLFAVSLVGMLVAAVSLYVLIGAMVCGILKVYLRKIDDRSGQVRFEDLWTGLSYFRPSLLPTILIVVPIVVWVLVLMVTMYIPLVIQLTSGGSSVNEDELVRSFVAVFIIDLAVALVMVCLHSLLIFCYPLIVDHGISGWDSIKLSARAVMRNLGGIGRMVGLNFVLVAAGALAAGIGIYLIMPLLTAANLVAYRKVFPK